MAERQAPGWEATGWDWFAGTTAADAPGSVAACFARCFAGADGARVLAHLRALTLDRALGADASDAALRQLEGQRRLVLTLIALAARGRSSPAAPGQIPPTAAVPLPEGESSHGR